MKIADLRFPGGTSAAIAHEIRALAGAGYSVALLQKDAAVLKRTRPIHPEIQACIDRGWALLVDASDSVEARLAVVHNPYVFAEPAARMPRLRCGVKVMVAHQPVRDSQGLPYYDAAAVHAHTEAVLGPGLVWAPISAISRRNLAAGSMPADLLPQDWTNLLFVTDWAAERALPLGDRPVIGRHSRPDWPKWPATREELLTVYPDGDAVEVRLLGVGDDVMKLLDGPVPANWRTFAFNEVDPSDFLRTIEFFVYYHHPDWVEAFGRTVAEAAASGAVVILPEHFRDTFREAALYRAPGEVVETVQALHADPEAYRLQARLGQRTIERMYGPEPYLARIADLIGTARAGVGGQVPASTPVRPAPEAGATTNDRAAMTFDVTIVGDFRGVRETAWRVANEVRIQHARGYRTALVHVATARCADLPHIHPEIDALIREGIAVAVDPATPLLRTRLLVAHQPRFLLDRVGSDDGLTLPRIVADTSVVIHDWAMSQDALRRTDSLLKTLFGPGVVWAATKPTLRDALAAAGTLQWLEDLWSVSICAPDVPTPRRRLRALPVIGRAGLCDASQWPTDEAETLAVYPPDGAAVRILGMPHTNLVPLARVPDSWETFGVDDISWGRFLASLDVFVYYPSAEPNEVPEHAIAAALINGTPVVLPPALRPHVGNGPVYARAADALAAVGRLCAEADTHQQQRWDMVRHARRRWGPDVHANRLRRFCGAPARAPAAPAVVGDAPARVLFLSSNGVGMGHLTRLLAIARRMPSATAPVFATMSHALPIVAQCGYPVEYVPFHGSAGCDPNDWNRWLDAHLGQILDFHEACAVVFDGGNPYQGLLDAIAARRDTRMVWVRRGMWRETQNNAAAIRRQRFFDLVIEPTDIAESADKGATAYNRAVALQVAPIRLLDEEDQLSRDDACAKLGLDPARPAALIQLGSGSNRDIVTMIDVVLAKLAERPEIQPVLAEWLISPSRIELWPEIKRLRGFPISRYYNAFDFTVSAAGYNSFNEIISFALPAIFMANDHATMDDQGGRAAYAEANDAGFCLPEGRADAIGPLVDAILDPDIRTVMRANCRRISRVNGAVDAANAIADLVA